MQNKPDLFNLPWTNSLTTSSPLFTSHSLIKPIHEQYGEETVKLFHRLIGVGLPTFSTLKKIHTFKIQGIVKLPRIDQKLRPLPTPSQGPPPLDIFSGSMHALCVVVLSRVMTVMTCACCCFLIIKVRQVLFIHFHNISMNAV